MTWRMDVRHTTGYRYTGEVVASYNEARLTPQSTADQVTIGARIDVDPPARLFPYWDYWGTLVHAFDLHVPHTELIVTATSTVETDPALNLVDATHVAWSDVDQAEVAERFYEYLVPSRAVVVDDELRAIAADLRVAATPAEAVFDVMRWVHGQLVYEQGQTTVATSALDAWRTGQGVCQDFVHLSVALLRCMGIPARYASGYLHPDPDAGVGATVVGESHAWAEAWLGDWHAFDPTNESAVDERHVLVGRGRDYHDVAPLKGIFTGAPAATPTVAVELTRRA